MTLLILRLEGAMQSWGTRSRFDDRDTSEMPGKSAVVGLLACALGYPRDDARIAELDTALRMGVRADRAGRMALDYQTITRQTGHFIDAARKERNVNGKEAGSPDTIISKRQYLQDACYTVVLEGEAGLLRRCAQALCDPVWQLYLGRKSFPPSRPILEGPTDAYAGIEHALRAYPLCSCVARRRQKPPARLRCEMDDAQGAFLRQDVVCVSGVCYAKRRVRAFYADMEGGNGV